MHLLSIINFHIINIISSIFYFHLPPALYKQYISVAQQQQYQPSTQQTVYHHQHNTQQQQPQPTVFTQQAQAQQQPQPTVFQAQQHQQHFLQQEPQPTQQQNFNNFNKSYSQKGFTNNNKL